jgi:hypothetical protein
VYRRLLLTFTGGLEYKGAASPIPQEISSLIPLRMVIPSISELQPYFSALAALLSVATLALVINIAKLMNDAAKARAEALEERLKGAQDDLQRTEKWNERRIRELTDEMTLYKDRLNASLSSAGKTWRRCY